MTDPGESTDDKLSGKSLKNGMDGSIYTYKHKQIKTEDTEKKCKVANRLRSLVQIHVYSVKWFPVLK